MFVKVASPKSPITIINLKVGRYSKNFTNIGAVVLILYQDVVKFQIPVHNLLCVYALKGLQEFVQYVPYI